MAPPWFVVLLSAGYALLAAAAGLGASLGLALAAQEPPRVGDPRTLVGAALLVVAALAGLAAVGTWQRRPQAWVLDAALAGPLALLLTGFLLGPVPAVLFAVGLLLALRRPQVRAWFEPGAAVA